MNAFVAMWLPVALWTLDLSIGALVVRWLFDVGGGAWGTAATDSMRFSASALPIGLSAALILGWLARQQLGWIADPSPVPQSFVSAGAVALKTLAYALVWPGLAFVSGAWAWGEAPRHPRRGAMALIVHVPLATLFAMDWLAVLQPHWYSTALGPRYLASQTVAGFAVVTLIRCLRVPRADGQQLADLATLLFASIVFWAYVAFMEFLIIWIGNLPREVTWYTARSSSGWLVVLAAAVACKLAIPGVLLLFRRVKGSARALAGVASIVLAGHLLDLIWEVSPSFAVEQGGAFRALLVTAAVLVLGGCWLFAARFTATTTESHAHAAQSSR